MSIDAKAVYEPVKDVLYDVTQKTVPVDASTLYRGEQRITAQVGGSSATGLNVGGVQTKFVIQNGSNFKLRWDTCALAVRGRFHTGAAQPAACALSCPAWNIIADQIDSIILTINDSSTAVYNISNGLYVYDYTARLFRNYTWDVLNNMDEQIFSPIEGNASPNWITRTNVPVYPALTAVQVERRARHRVAELASRETKFISFQDLFPRFPACIMNNLRKIQLEIVWRNHSVRGMEHGVGAAGTECYLITNAEIVTDYYVLAPATQITEINQKASQAVDNVAYLNTQVLDYTYTGGDIIISGLKNIDSVMVMQMARGQVNVDSTVIGQSCGQFMLVSAGATSATTTFPDNESEAGAAGTLVPLTSAQLQLGEITYPPQELSIINDGSPDLGHLYQEYLKCLNVCASRTSKPIPFGVFKSTLPFVCLKPWSNNAPHLSREGRDLILRLRSALPAAAGRNVAIVVFKTMVMQVTPDSSVSINY